MDQPRNHDVPTPGVKWTVRLRSRSVLGAQEQQRCSSRVVSQLGVCGISNLDSVSREPVVRDPCGHGHQISSSTFSSRNDRRNFWRSIRRSRSGEFLTAGHLNPDFNVSCRPGSQLRCAYRTPFHRFRSTCFSHRGSRRIGRAAEARHQ